ncbi:hypothetical protein H4R21_001770 [Coemansia helicoidea]|uniref:Uncharacterized protein n=1 Tax=Coemansia helicoidea TaxID=1286919 RepID=A0ACC1LB86_9FUNG|nr:hypothetical protein H4R21_001770 [Coemansia helicoidea]
MSNVPDYEAKYRSKLLERAQAAGVSTIDELKQKIGDEAAAAAKREQVDQNAAAQAAPGADAAAAAGKSQAAQAPQAGKQSAGALPPNVKTLDQIMRLDLLDGKNTDEIGEIWRAYHAGRDGVSAVIPAAAYQELMAVAKKNPLFVLPLPRSEGVEFFFLQFNYHQVHFTSLLEYKTATTNARPYLTLTHYTDLMDSKGVVLMRGEIDTTTRHVDAHNAQYLALQMQQFYVTGGPEKRRLLELFNQKPAEFDYRALVDAAAKL